MAAARQAPASKSSWNSSRPPTGPLHVGHGRQAALGDALSSLFDAQGYQVTREFYYNDAGVQIQTLANSVQARARGFKPGDAEWPESAYNGDYIADIANDFKAGKTVSASMAPRRQGNGRHRLEPPVPVTTRRRTSTCRPRSEVRKLIRIVVYADGRYSAVETLIKRPHYEGWRLWLRTPLATKGRGCAGRRQYTIGPTSRITGEMQRGSQASISRAAPHGTIARVRAGLQAATCIQQATRLSCAQMVRHEGRRRGQIAKRAGSYGPARPDRMVGRRHFARAATLRFC